MKLLWGIMFKNSMSCFSHCKAPGETDSLGKNLWTVCYIILGMTQGSCMLHAPLAFTRPAILLV